jgi:hypothetical protein
VGCVGVGRVGAWPVRGAVGRLLVCQGVGRLVALSVRGPFGWLVSLSRCRSVDRLRSE